jgi:signal peptidase I
MTSSPRIYVGRKRRKSPWLAVNLTAALPGVGQIYSSAVGKGVAIATASILLILFCLWSIFAPRGHTLWGLLALLPLLGLYGFALWDSYHTVTRSRIPAAIGLETHANPSDPWYPALLSHVLPGLGQLYLQKAVAGGLLLVAGISTSFLANFYPYWLPLPPLLWALGCGHAYWSATSRNGRQGKWLALLLAAIIFLRFTISSGPVVVQRLLEQCIVPSISMLPTLQVNDRIFVRQWGEYVPTVGDIVVFYNPEEVVGENPTQNTPLAVKRVIALPGQEVEVRAGQVWLDGLPLVEPYLAEPPGYQWGPEIVTPDHVFVLGDNRNTSRDSRIWGFLPQRLILGRAYKIYWPPHRVQPLD